MRVFLAAMVAMVPALAGAASEPAPGPEPEGDLSRFESTTVISGLAVVVERASDRLVADRDTTYRIAVQNRGDQPETATIRATVPPWMSEATPQGNVEAEVGKGFVDWPVTVAPGEATTLQLTGVYDSPDQETPTRVAFTACALDTDEAQPIVCATDIARLQAPSSGSPWGWVAAIAAAVAVAAGTAYLLWRRRRQRAAATVVAPDAPAIESAELPELPAEPEPAVPAEVPVAPAAVPASAAVDAAEAPDEAPAPAPDEAPAPALAEADAAEFAESFELAESPELAESAEIAEIAEPAQVAEVPDEVAAEQPAEAAAESQPAEFQPSLLDAPEAEATESSEPAAEPVDSEPADSGSDELVAAGPRANSGNSRE